MTRRHIQCIDHPLSPNPTDPIPNHAFATQSSSNMDSGKWSHVYRRKCFHQPLRRNSEDSIYVQAILHKVQKTDTLAGISLFYGIPLPKLKKVNRLWTNDSIHSRRALYIPLKDCLSLKDYTIDKEAQAITFHKALPNGSSKRAQEVRSHSPDDAIWQTPHNDSAPYTMDDDSQFVPTPAHDRPKVPSFGVAYSEYPFYQETASESSYASSSDSSSFTKLNMSNSIQSPTFPPASHIVEYTADIVTVKAADLSFFAPAQPNQTSSCPPTPPLNCYSTSPPLSTYQPTSGYAKSWMDGIRTSLEGIRPSTPNPSPNEHKLTVFSINGQPEQKGSEWL